MENQNLINAGVDQPEGDAVVHVGHNPTLSVLVCPKCGGELVRRIDPRSHTSIFECENDECGYFED
jgi:predicted RNA-binding Zn-ribbon protein involved in translation (DUF1610 family)